MGEEFIAVIDTPYRYPGSRRCTAQHHPLRCPNFMDELMAPDTLSVLLDYLLRLPPIIGVLIAGLYFTPALRQGLRVLILIAAFICLRDQMTPAGLWALSGQPPLRFHANPWVLFFLGSASMVSPVLIRTFLAQCWQLVVGFKASPVAGLAVGTWPAA
ncbi:hypothetical protein [Pseudomonas sp. KNUC1026]|uniref:hypothetical protein n=1 Tax=Pseudomonas sp. KNUC1026 TaxID=2893890 RepID=UPI002E302BB4|nr:hypothetical protein [Pseudomonas sp. KNUC1026]